VITNVEKDSSSDSVLLIWGKDDPFLDTGVPFQYVSRIHISSDALSWRFNSTCFVQGRNPLHPMNKQEK